MVESIQGDGTDSHRLSSERAFRRPEIFNDLRERTSTTPASLPVNLRTSTRSCACTNPNDINKVPTVEAFATNMNNWFKPVRIDGISGVIGATEVRQIACEAGESTFTSEATLTAYGVPEDIVSSELDLTRYAFVASYNIVADQSCDPSFKVVEMAKVTVADDNDSFASTSHDDVFDSTRRLQQPRNTRRFKLKVVVTGRCKMCSKQSPLFNDALRRQLSPYEHVVMLDSAEESRRELGFVVNKNTCLCAVQAIPVQSGASQFEITHWTFTVCLGAKNHLQNVILQNVNLQNGFWLLKMIF